MPSKLSYILINLSITLVILSTLEGASGYQTDEKTPWHVNNGRSYMLIYYH